MVSGDGMSEWHSHQGWLHRIPPPRSEHYSSPLRGNASLGEHATIFSNVLLYASYRLAFGIYTFGGICQRMTSGRKCELLEGLGYQPIPLYSMSGRGLYDGREMQRYYRDKTYPQSFPAAKYRYLL